MKRTFSLKLDLSENGFDMFFKQYHQKVFNVLWVHPEGLSSRKVWELTNRELSQTISRASIINFLSDAAELGLLDYRLESGKGGFHRIYWHKYDRSDFIDYLISTVHKALETLKKPTT